MPQPTVEEQCRPRRPLGGDRAVHAEDVRWGQAVLVEVAAREHPRGPVGFGEIVEEEDQVEAHRELPDGRHHGDLIGVEGHRCPTRPGDDAEVGRHHELFAQPSREELVDQWVVQQLPEDVPLVHEGVQPLVRPAVHAVRSGAFEKGQPRRPLAGRLVVDTPAEALDQLG